MNKNIKLIFTLFVMFQTFPCMAQKEDLNVRDPKVNEGKLFTLSYTPGSGLLVVALAGSPAVSMGPQQVTVFGREISPGGKERRLKIVPVENGFHVADKIPPEAALRIDIEDLKTRRRETIQIRP